MDLQRQIISFLKMTLLVSKELNGNRETRIQLKDQV